VDFGCENVKKCEEVKVEFILCKVELIVMKFDQRVSLKCLQNLGKVVSEKFDEFSEAKVSCSDD